MRSSCRSSTTCFIPKFVRALVYVTKPVGARPEAPIENTARGRHRRTVEKQGRGQRDAGQRLQIVLSSSPTSELRPRSSSGWSSGMGVAGSRFRSSAARRQVNSTSTASRSAGVARRKAGHSWSSSPSRLSHSRSRRPMRTADPASAWAAGGIPASGAAARSRAAAPQSASDRRDRPLQDSHATFRRDRHGTMRRAALDHVALHREAGLCPKPPIEAQRGEAPRAPIMRESVEIAVGGGVVRLAGRADQRCGGRIKHEKVQTRSSDR